MKLAIFLSFLLSTAAVGSADVKVKHQKLFDNVEHIRVDFDQTVYKKLRDRKLNRSGRAYFTKPNKFRWNFSSKKLGDEEFYYDGQKLTHYRAAEKTVTNYNANIGLAKELNEVVSLVLNPQNLYNRYDIVDSKSTTGQTKIALKPRGGVATDVKAIAIVINDEKKFVEDIKITYMDDNYTTFAFKNPVFDANPMDLFQFSKKGKFTIRDHG